MRTTILRILSLFIIILIVINSVSCSSSVANGTEETLGVEFALDKEYTIVCNSFYKQSSDITSSLTLLQSAFEKSCGLKVSYSTENQDGSDSELSSEYVILLGPCQRQESATLWADLKIDDYTYNIVSENVIVICGGSTASTLKATEKFCADVLLYENGKAINGEKKTNVGLSYTYRGEYPYSNLTLNGIDIKDFKIAIHKSAEIGMAQSLLLSFGSYTGHQIPIVTFDELTGNEKGVICFKAYSRDGVDKYNALADGSVMRFVENSSGITIGVDFTHQKYYYSVLEEFSQKATHNKNGSALAITLPKNDLKVYNFDRYYKDLPTWKLQNETTQNVRDGVTYIERKYTDENTLPYKAYILLIDPKKASLYMGSSNNSISSVPEVKQSVIDHMKSAQAAGVDVIAGINGDFFNIASDYSPLGLTIKEGKIIRTNPDRPYCAFTYDGRLVIGLSGALPENRDEFRTSVGGSDVIIYDGIPYDIAEKTDFGDTSHPRTLAGVRADGTIILAVIDGRQPSLSNGAPLGQCARFMMDLGAEYAINLDGGGSSTMVIKNGAVYGVKNSPSDGAPRKVYNSLIVVAN